MSMLRKWVENEELRPLSGSVLKWIAVITMFIDHLGASLIEVFILDPSGASSSAVPVFDYGFWTAADGILRAVGRTAFPLFAFLLAQGAVHTRDARKYLARLILFAFISEITFDLATADRLFFIGHQNVFFTLALGLAAVIVLQRSAGCEWKAFIALLISMTAAELLSTDYGAVGVAVIFVLYYFRDRRFLSCVLSFALLVLGSLSSLYTIPAFILIELYNGKRGGRLKYFFYWFYPVHLTALWTVGSLVSRGAMMVS